MSADTGASVLERAKAAYLGLAIGDALGATVEFMTPNEIRHKHGIHKDIVGGGWLKLKPGRVTDDTEMSLYLGSALLDCKQVDATAIADAFSEWMRSKPVDIGNTVRRGIIHYRSCGEVSVPNSEHNAGNGACMRTLPIALATLGAEYHAVVTMSRIQAHITHHSELSDLGTEHIIKLIQLALSGQHKSILEQETDNFILENPIFSFRGKKMTNPGGYIVETLQAVFQAFYSSNDFESCLIDVVNRGGDSDTTGAIAGMLAGSFCGLQSIPKKWLRRLDSKIKTACEKQAEALLEIAPIALAATDKQSVSVGDGEKEKSQAVEPAGS